MALTLGDFVAQRLDQWGVQRICVYRRDGINGITAGLRRLGRIEFVQVPARGERRICLVCT